MAEAIQLGPDSWDVNKEAGRFFLGRPRRSECHSPL